MVVEKKKGGGGGNNNVGFRSLIRRKQVDSVHVKSEGHQQLARELYVLQLLAIGSMKPGQGHAIFTAECSHTFHFKCITSNVKHGNHVCPVCRSTWKLMPVHTTTAPTDSQSSPVVGSSATRVTPMNPLPDERRAHQLPNRRAFWCESHHFKDDEPLCHINDSLDLTSPLAVSADQLVTIKAFPEVPAVGAAESLAAFTVLVGVQAPPLSEDTHQQARAPIDLVTVLVKKH
ncbi:hypothetical protein IFM89_014000 [Coptis chinensis]|uniref:RING-type domain-containing protein n=1 Tax=Coptis chinensis TaxID=261450 RepID=A0A835IMU6_9MAGN|nr:hypothetical protein IFM89_014000 [Coptis chinensis]